MWYAASVPRKCEWIERVPSALAALRAIDCPTIDRRGVEILLGLSPRQALRVLAAVPGSYAAGKSLLIARGDLVVALERVLAGEDARREQRRRERVRERLEAARREAAARRVRIPAAAETGRERIPDLPAGIRLSPGELRIAFSGAEDLLRQLVELSRAIMNDYARFEALVEQP